MTRMPNLNNFSSFVVAIHTTCKTSTFQWNLVGHARLFSRYFCSSLGYWWKTQKLRCIFFDPFNIDDVLWNRISSGFNMCWSLARAHCLQDIQYLCQVDQSKMTNQNGGKRNNLSTIHLIERWERCAADANCPARSTNGCFHFKKSIILSIISGAPLYGISTLLRNWAEEKIG